MLGELKDKNFYCCGFSTDICGHFPVCPEICRQRHRKHPTPEQYREEYGDEYTDDRPVWVLKDTKLKGWDIAVYRNTMHPKGLYTNGHYIKVLSVVCACTPFGKPDKDWRPE